MAANRAGLTTVILPAENQKELEEVPIEARSHMIFAPVDRVDQVLGLALEDRPEEQVRATGQGNGGEGTPGATGPPGPSSIETESIVAKPR